MKHTEIKVTFMARYFLILVQRSFANSSSGRKLIWKNKKSIMAINHKTNDANLGMKLQIVGVNDTNAHFNPNQTACSTL